MKVIIPACSAARREEEEDTKDSGLSMLIDVKVELCDDGGVICNHGRAK
jgi:hypothetical protein